MTHILDGKKAIIFDLDGTLLDTLADLADSANYTIEQMGYSTHPLESYRYFVGNGVPKLLERCLPDDKRNEKILPQRGKFSRSTTAYILRTKQSHTRVFPSCWKSSKTAA